MGFAELPRYLALRTNLVNGVGVLNIPKYIYTAFEGSCDSTDVSGLIDLLLVFARSVNTVHAITRTVQGKTVYLAKITDKLVTKVNNLQSALRSVDNIFKDWQEKLQHFSTHENCHFNNFMEFLSKFSLEVTRSFSSQLRFIEILIFCIKHTSYINRKQLA